MILRPGEELPKIHNIVTSFNEQGYHRYGKEFIRTFKEHWPANVRLTVYYEGDEFDYEEGVSWKPIEEVEHLRDFMSSLQFPIMHGIVGDHYNINFDARMARKTFIQNHALNTYGGKVFWLDADMVTHSPVPASFLDEMLPDDKFCCFLSRDGWYYTESGFLGFNKDHKLSGPFMHSYINVFITGVVFTLKGWHDCFAFDATRMLGGEEHAGEFVNLAEGLPHGVMHPFVNSRLGAYMDHRKGARKDGGNSKKDLVIPRTEGYWNAS